MTPNVTKRSISAGIASGLAIALLAGCTTGEGGSGASTASGDGIFPDSRMQSLVDGVVQRSVAEAPESRLAEGLLPPTNQWFSGLVFGGEPLPVFPLPLSFNLTEPGFAFGLPEVTTGAQTISAPFTPSITVDAGAATSEISAYDEASVTIDQLNSDGEPIGAVTIAQGSPLVSFTAEQDVELTLGAPFEPVDGELASATVADTEYGLTSSGELDGSTLALASGESAVWFAVPEDGDIAELAASAAPVESTSIEYSVDGETASTTLGYEAQGDTLIAALPHQQAEGADAGLGSYESAYGTMTLQSGTNLSWTSPAIEPSSSVDVSTLDDNQRATLAEQVKEDAAGEIEMPADTYFGGKAMYRLANILDLAEQLGDEESAAVLSKRLSGALAEWMEPGGCDEREERCFVYDSEGKGIVGLAPSFGSEEFNDHHFHYGYFFFAASVAAKYDDALLEKIEPVMTLLAADVATSGESTLFPERRAFDAYAGHSWASGYSPFADGNNQESSSEAVLAWNGLALWAATTDDAPLETQARWMLAAEADSANAYWTNFDRTESVYEGYEHSIAPLNWGAKRDYATWFSAEPAAKLAIIALPMSPASEYLGTEPERVDENVAAATPGGFDVQYGDWLLMYAGLGTADNAELVSAAKSMPEELLDDGNSRSYMLAWLMTR